MLPLLHLLGSTYLCEKEPSSDAGQSATSLLSGLKRKQSNIVITARRLLSWCGTQEHCCVVRLPTSYAIQDNDNDCEQKPRQMHIFFFLLASFRLKQVSHLQAVSRGTDTSYRLIMLLLLIPCDRRARKWQNQSCKSLFLGYVYILLQYIAIYYSLHTRALLRPIKRSGLLSYDMVANDVSVVVLTHHPFLQYVDAPRLLLHWLTLLVGTSTGLWFFLFL